jgi:cytochrome c oxidase subunit 1
MSELLGKLHFWPSLIFMNGIFLPMLIQGLGGVSRRLYDGGELYQFSEPVIHYNKMMSHSAWGLAVAQIPFIINFFWSLRRGERVGANPWQATTLEWAAPSPPPHGNFATPPAAYRGPYEYSPPDGRAEFLPQFQPEPHGTRAEV